MPKGMLTIKEAADISEVARAAVYFWVRDGKLPSTYDRKRDCYLIRSSDLTALNKQRAAAASNGRKTTPVSGKGRHHTNGGKKSVPAGPDGSVSGKEFWTMREAMERTGLSRNRIMEYSESGDIELFRNPNPGRRGNPGYAMSDSDFRRLMSVELDEEPAVSHDGERPSDDVVLSQYWKILGRYLQSGTISSIYEVLDRFRRPDYLEIILGERPSRKNFADMRMIAIGARSVTPEQMERFMEIYRDGEPRRDLIARQFSETPESFLRNGLAKERAVERHTKQSELFELGETVYRRHWGEDSKGPYVRWTYENCQALPTSMSSRSLERVYCESRGLDFERTAGSIRI